MLWSSSSAPDRRMKAIATSNTTSDPVTRRDRRPAEAPAASRRDGSIGARLISRAGATPKSMPVINEIPRVKRKTLPSSAIPPARGKVGRSHSEQRLERPRGGQAAQTSSEECEDQRLHEKESGHSGARGAQGHAKGDFLSPTAGARQQQTRGVGAADEQDQSDGREQRPEDRARARGQAVGEGTHEDIGARILGRALSQQCRGEDPHPGGGLRGRNFRPEAPDCSEVAARPAGLWEARGIPQGREDLGGLRRVGRENGLEVAGKNPGHEGRHVAEPNRPAGDFRVCAEASSPETVGKEDDAVGSRGVLGGKEVAADGRSDAQQTEESVRDAGPHDAFRGNPHPQKVWASSPRRRRSVRTTDYGPASPGRSGSRRATGSRPGPAPGCSRSAPGSRMAAGAAARRARRSRWRCWLRSRAPALPRPSP